MDIHKNIIIPKVKYNEISKELDILHSELGYDIFWLCRLPLHSAMKHAS